MNHLQNIPCNLKVEVFGDNNTITCGKGTWFPGEIYVGLKNFPINNCTITIGNNITCAGSIFIRVLENGTKVSIGNDCLLSDDIKIYASDTHSIYDAQTKKLLNEGKFITIEDHVWICRYAKILKNTIIPKNSVVGIDAVVSGTKFTEPGSIIAGNPARVVKTGINWSHRYPHQYLQEIGENI